MPLGKKEAKIIIDMKDNYNVISRVYNSIYSSIAEEFKIYLDSQLGSKKDKIEKDFDANGNELLTIRESESALEILDFFSWFCYLNGRLTTVSGQLFELDGKKSVEVEGEKLKLKQLDAKRLMLTLTTQSAHHLFAPQLLFSVEMIRLQKTYALKFIKS